MSTTLERLIDFLTSPIISKGIMALTFSLVLNSPTAIQAAPKSCQKGATLEYTLSEANIAFGNHQVEIKKISSQGVEVKIDQTFNIVTYQNQKDFMNQIAKQMDYHLGQKRQHVGYCLNAVYHKLNLADNSNQTPKIVGELPDLLTAPLGTYTLKSNENPLTYLLVRTANRKGRYCLSMVQEVFDLMYGLGEAKRIGLYSGKYAGKLTFKKSPSSMETYSPTKHKKIAAGKIIRFATGAGHLSSIGISLGQEKIIHLVGDKLYLEKLQPKMAEGWIPAKIITPDDSFQKKEKPNLTYTGEIGKRVKTLEQIGPLIKRKYQLDGNQATIDEIIYQFNKDKFEIAQGYSASAGSYQMAVLKNRTQLRIPQGWK